MGIRNKPPLRTTPVFYLDSSLSNFLQHVHSALSALKQHMVSDIYSVMRGHPEC